ncbi:hypothetical protein CLAFUW4_12400 [Fulvia fulva]|uniref:Uncharacterized protein n=1 Tax=Passalora fulva TaxID=5499 RepID=A0A9Q8USU3_PASFU|nr:uncharacterized protein CLAFUR5_11428 [Fulvia fulva]KAK4617558.1 hypothetical protein CLAFUR4_12405 [Fulvia fulva]KAK4618623.1 hypothetical protein CLAFUR0_12416 [Fulvia fulva]UJO21158.1 hypothetical protein CLAFUR5_11428 [Fulvia fulva]WPV17888.1 hypothetical protein CLAFUW4_12400 [Fulvia fulva]WPV33192.1 hypothetical protein CLAFUW7_12407 [Fulvia fulva]
MHSVKRLGFLAVVACCTLLGPLFFGYHFSTIRDSSWEYLDAVSSGHLTKSGEQTKHFHLVLPATGPNDQFCKLLLSAGITGYPEPIFVGWAGHGVYNGTESHLFKITETLAYLRSLPPSADDDLVLILDAYDIWLQLRPDVLIGRYFEVLRKNDKRVKAEGIYGKQHGGAVIKHSIVQGPDKIHWPQGDQDAATWAVPESPLPRNAFGPLTDTDMFTARPRWLNSGTIMGPVKDMRDYFSATVDMLSRKYDSTWQFRNSDQYYFAEVWAEQEVIRLQLRDGENFTAPIVSGGGSGIVPFIPEGRRTEFGVCLDYETEMFQTAAAFDRHVTWMRFNGSTQSVSGYPGDAEEIGLTLQQSTSTKRIDQWVLQNDTLRSDGPWSAADPKDLPGIDEGSSWEDVMLGVNVVTQIAFPLFHITGDKSLRDRWWPRMWFHPWSEQLLKAAKRKQANSEDPSTFLVQNGVRYKQARPDGKESYGGPGADEKGGAWIADGEYVPWRDMCTQFEDQIFLKHMEGLP